MSKWRLSTGSLSISTQTTGREQISCATGVSQRREKARPAGSDVRKFCTQQVATSAQTKVEYYCMYVSSFSFLSSFCPCLCLFLSSYMLSHHACSQEYRVTRLCRINGHLNRVVFARIAAVAVDARKFDLFQNKKILFALVQASMYVRRCWREEADWADTKIPP